MFEQVKAALEKRNYAVRVFATGQEAKEYVLSQVEGGQSVGIGGSITVKDLALDQALAEKGCPIHWHWTAQDKDGAHVDAAVADVYLTSANALTEDGLLINIDGHGNRVAATLHGPAKVWFIIGKNKLAKDYAAGMEHIKTVSCPANARRLGLKTPCAQLGYCTDCSSPQRMCNATVILERAMSSHPTEILLVEEDLGY